MDRITHLPANILHEILSRLPREDAARTSTLSKAWKNTWSTFPILVFSDALFGVSEFPVDRNNPQEMEDLSRKRNNFFNFVDNTLLRFHEQGLAVKEFKLIMASYDPQTLSHRFNQWMKLASECGVGVLELSFSLPGYPYLFEHYYCLPPSFLEAKSLIKLVLSGGLRIDQAFLNHPVKFSSLQVLYLSRVYLGDEEVIQNLILSCPLIEYITLEFCSILKYKSIEGHVTPRLDSVRIHRLPKLKGVKVIGIQEIDVDAPSLEDFRYSPAETNAPFKINVDRCENLRELDLRTTIITDQWWHELFSKFPLLQRLKLFFCTIPERIKVSSHRLEFMCLFDCSNLKEVIIDAPNLYSFFMDINDGVTMPTMSFLNSSSQLEIVVSVDINLYLDFPRLREFLQNLKPQNFIASLSLRIRQPSDEFDPDVLQEISVPPLSIKLLHLHLVPDDGTSCLPLVTSLLWSCRPAIISILLCRKTFIKHFCELLMGRNEEDCFCSSGPSKCWWHGLKDVKVTSSCKTYENVDLKTFLDVEPTLATEGKLSFILDW